MSNIYTFLIEQIDGGLAILTTPLHPDIPTLIDVGVNRALATDSPPVHVGSGLFKAQVLGAPIYFDGGGAMNRVYAADGKWLFSWSGLDADEAQLRKMGYDLAKVRAALTDLADQWDKAHGSD